MKGIQGKEVEIPPRNFLLDASSFRFEFEYLRLKSCWKKWKTENKKKKEQKTSDEEQKWND